MEQANTKKALEFEVGENVEILPIGEEELGIDDDSKLRVRFRLSPEHQKLYQKGVDGLYKIKDEILKQAER